MKRNAKYFLGIFLLALFAYWFSSSSVLAWQVEGTGEIEVSAPEETPSQSHASYLCYNNDAYWYDSKGNKEEKKEECGENSCENWGQNFCENNSIYRQRTCYNRGCSGNSCYINSYSDKQIVKNCDSNESCENGECVGQYIPHLTQKCYDNDVYWYDSQGNREEKKEECGSSEYSGDNYCYQGNVYRDFITRDCSGNRCSSPTSKPKLIQDCENKGCSRGVCNRESASESRQPSCAIEIRKDGIKINKINISESLDIYVVSLSGAINKVRFLSDENQNNKIDVGFDWTRRYNWDKSLENWNAQDRIMNWYFATAGEKEVWAEVEDDNGQSAKCSTNILMHEPREMKVIRLVTQEAIGGVPVTVDEDFYIILTLKSYIDPITLEVAPNVKTKVYVEATENYPLSNPEIGRKIGLIDLARNWQQGVGSPENIDQKKYSQVNNRWLIHQQIEYGDALAEAIPTGLIDLIVDLTVRVIKEEVSDPMTELRDTIAYGGVSQALDNYLLALKIAGDEITDYEVARSYLEYYWTGEAYEYAAFFLLDEVNEILKSRADRIWDYLKKEVLGEISFSLSAFVQVARGAKRAMDLEWEYIDRKDGELRRVQEMFSKSKLYGASAYTLELAQSPRIAAEANSPIELRIYDSQRRITGMVNGEEKNEIPYSTFDKSTVTIFFPTDFYRYEVAGTDSGNYGLVVTSVGAKETTTFVTTDVSTSAGVVHRYTINWNALSEEQGGVNVEIDADGDGLFEKVVTTVGSVTRTSNEDLSPSANEEKKSQKIVAPILTASLATIWGKISHSAFLMVLVIMCLMGLIFIGIKEWRLFQKKKEE